MSRSRNPRATGRRVSLRDELGLLTDAIDGARLLGDFARNGHADTVADQSAALAGASATLTLVLLRLRKLDAAIEGDVDVEQLAAPHNAAKRDDQQVDHHLRDVLLPLSRRRS